MLGIGLEPAHEAATAFYLLRVVTRTDRLSEGAGNQA